MQERWKKPIGHQIQEKIFFHRICSPGSLSSARISGQVRPIHFTGTWQIAWRCSFIMMPTSSKLLHPSLRKNKKTMLTDKLFDHALGGAQTVRFYPRQCIRSRYNKNNCDSCLTECQPGALTLDGRTVILNQEKCTGCMRCVPVCPNDALSDGTNILDLLERLKDRTIQTFSCRQESQNRKLYRIPCIGFFSEPILAVMLHLSADTMYFDTTFCLSCMNSHALGAFREKVTNLASTAGNKERVPEKFQMAGDRLFTHDKTHQRRSFLLFCRNTVSGFRRNADNQTTSNKASQLSIAEKKPTRDSLALQFGLDTIHDEEERKFLLSYSFSVDADKSCDLCPACTGMCPTGALRRVKDKQSKMLYFTRSRCNGCGLCSDFCKKNALTVSKGHAGKTEEIILVQMGLDT